MRYSIGCQSFILASLGLLIPCATLSAQATRPSGTTGGKVPSVKTAQVPLGPAAPSQGGIPRQGGAPTVPATPRAPFAPLAEDHQKYLDDILKFWEQSSSDIKRYTCKFERWEYEPVFGPPDTYKTYSTGNIKYEAPDKGLFQVEKIRHYTPPKNKGEDPKYVTRPDDFGDHWICDGQSVFEFNYPKKQLIERQLPPDMRGQAIADGPLPFLFGAKADKIKERYWVRVVTPADAKGEYWLEAFPKSRSDAANFKKIEIIIDEKDFLPKAIQVFYPGYDPKSNPVRAVFMFAERKKNGLILDPLGLWTKSFHKPPTPKGWEKIVEKYPTDEPPVPAKTASTAKKPTGTKK